eukprot:3122677-Pyramimonas_sp.AAC.1
MSAIMDIPYGQSLTDVESYYDTMFWLKLVRAAARMEFPPTVLYLELVQCARPRTLNQLSAFSAPFE